VAASTSKPPIAQTQASTDLSRPNASQTIATPPQPTPGTAMPSPGALQRPTAFPAPAVATPPSDADELEALPPIAVLGAGERSALPPLKLSMHVFGSDSGKRFAIIDGQRVTEGSVLGAGVVEQIRRDGVVLNVNGRRILLPRP
jgi:general secretion pathway protein B